MKATIQHKNQIFEIDLSKPIDISIPLTNTDENPIAWYIEKPVIEPVVFGDWIGKVSEGKSSTNFNNIFFNFLLYKIMLCKSLSAKLSWSKSSFLLVRFITKEILVYYKENEDSFIELFKKKELFLDKRVATLEVIQKMLTEEVDGLNWMLHEFMRWYCKQWWKEHFVEEIELEENKVEIILKFGEILIRWKFETGLNYLKIPGSFDFVEKKIVMVPMEQYVTVSPNEITA